MHDAQNAVTLGEVYRLVKAVKEEHGAELAEIKQQVTISNTRTTKLETRVDGIDREIRDLKRAAAEPAVVAPVPAPTLTPELKELLEVARDVKGVMRFGRGVWAVGGAAVPILLYLLAQLKW